MKLAGQDGDIWRYLLSPGEAGSLLALVSQFPVAAAAPAKISLSEADPKTLEREKLLNESLAEQRADLKKRAAIIISPDRLKASGKGRVLQINTEEREILLQILNDIRIGSWRVLGEPDNLEPDFSKLPESEQRYWRFLHVAGYFQCQLLEPIS